MRAAVYAAVGLLALAAASAGSAARAASTLEPDVPYVVTPPAVVDAMLEIAGIGPDDFLIDLGSGDGRIVIAAAKRLGARGLGVDIDGDLVSAARREAEKQGVADRATFVEENLFLTDLRRATVVTLYLYPHILAELRPRLLAGLRPGARIVSHDFGIEGWKPDAQRFVPVPDKPYGPPGSAVYLWIVPANAAGTWRWRSGGEAGAVDFQLSLAQSLESLKGVATAGGAPARFDDGRVRGRDIRFTLEARIGGERLRHEFRGRVEGDTIGGRVTVAGVERDWKATRTTRGVISPAGGER